MTSRFGRGRQVQYLVHWKGYPEADNQWISWSDLNAPELLVEFQRENPDAVVHIRTGQSEGTTPAFPLPPTSLPRTLHNFVYMFNGSAPLLQGSAQAQDSALSLYKAAAAEVGDDTAGSAIIRHIMAITQAAADGDAAEASEREEANTIRSQGDDPEDEATGSVDRRMVLARVSAQPGVHHAAPNSERGQELRPLLIPAEAYPPSGSAASPIDVNTFHMPIDVDAFDRKSPVSIHGSPLTHSSGYDLNFFKSRSPISTRSHSHDIPNGPIAHAQLRLAIPIGNETPPLCHSDGSTMHHHETWGLRDVPAASPNYAPSEDRPDIVPVGFIRNEGPGRVNFPITDLQGCTQQPDYVQVVMTYDPFVLAIGKNNPYLYGQALHIKPHTMTEHCPRYDPSDLHMFKTYNPHRAETDALVHSLEDASAITEVHRWRRLMSERAKLERDMQRVLQSVHDAGMEQERIQICMESANLLGRLEFARQLRRPQHGRR